MAQVKRQYEAIQLMLAEGASVEEIALRTKYPVDYIRDVVKALEEEHVERGYNQQSNNARSRNRAQIYKKNA